MAKQHQTKQNFRFFNTTPYNKYGLFDELETLTKDLSNKFNTQTPVTWVTAKEKSENLKKVTIQYFEHYWANSLVFEFGFILWNAVYDQHGRDKKAENMANDAVTQLERNFK